MRLFWALFRHVSKEASNGHGRFGGSVCQGSLLTCLKQQGSSLTRLQQQDSALTPLASISAYFQGRFKLTWSLWGQRLPRFPFDMFQASPLTRLQPQGSALTPLASIHVSKEASNRDGRILPPVPYKAVCSHTKSKFASSAPLPYKAPC